MKIHVREIGSMSRFAEVTFITTDLQFSTGLINAHRRKHLAQQLINAAQALLDGLDEQEAAGAENASLSNK